ncbi:MAG: DUF4386 domain-containing protein [Gemmatimonadaceae bacterium]|jgi:hypothetical protein|nr:DUF4386 domain-containing protein [Gemmatimonadaceae bacterium]
MDDSPPAPPASLLRTARLTGLFYLGLAVTGMLGFLMVRGRILVADDAAATLANLTAHASLARIGVGLEMAIVLTQTLAAVWFFRLFRSVDSFAAGTIAAFGLVNAIAILGSAAMLASALEVAGDATLAAGGDVSATVQLFYVVSGNLWGVGAIFFGLWLIPMGWVVLRSGWMPRALGWLLIAGGIGYVVSAFIGEAVPDAGGLTDLLTMPATIGEFWVIGYLLLFGVRARSA